MQPQSHNILYAADVSEIQQTRLFGRVCCLQLVLDHRRGYLSTVFVKRQHHGETVPQGEVIPGEVKSFPTLVQPDRADARPNFLPCLSFPVPLPW